MDSEPILLIVLQAGIKGVWAPRGLVGGMEWQSRKKEDKVIHLIRVIKLQPLCSDANKEEQVLSCRLVGTAQLCWESDLAADTENIPIPHFLWKTGSMCGVSLIFLNYLCLLIACMSDVY